MKRLWITLLSFSFALPVFGEDPHTLREGYYLGSAYVGQNGSVLLAEAAREGFSSILIRKQGSEVQNTWSLPDLRVNALGWLSEEDLTFFVSGSTGHYRVDRIYQIEEQKLLSLWDSIGLSNDLSNAEIQVSKDGQLWSAVSYGQNSATVAVGPTTGYEVTKTWSFAYGDGPFGDPLHSSSVILKSDPKSPSLALLWHGVLQILGGQHSVLHLETPEEFEVSGLYFQEQANILWGVASYGRLIGFDLEQLVVGGPAERPGNATLKIYPERLGIKGFTDLAEHPSGDLLIQGRNGERRVLLRLDPHADSNSVREVVPMAEGSRLAGWGVLTPSSDGLVGGDAGWVIGVLHSENRAP